MKKRNKKEKPSDLFNFFVIISLAPIDWSVKIKYYPLSVILALLITAVWGMPVLFIGTVISVTAKFAFMSIKLIKSLIYGN